MSTALMAPIHPGEVLAEEYLAPPGIAQHKLAVAIGVPPRRINEIVHGTRRISAHTALRSTSSGRTPTAKINPLFCCVVCAPDRML